MSFRSIVTQPLVLVLLLSALLSFYPTFDRFLTTGIGFEGVPQTYTDEFIYYAHIREVATGNFFFGNPYFIEHRNDPTLALFGSSVLGALPLFFGMPLNVALQLDFIIWGGIFILLAYAVLRECGVGKWISALGSLFAYLQSYDLVYRVSVQQQVFPFFFLFYLTLIRVLKEPGNRLRIGLLAFATGSTFYVYGFLWQLAVATLGLVGLYALIRRAWPLVKSILVASVLGGVLGAPAFAYTLWITHAPFFWESMNRWGLVNSHLPMGEVITSGFVVPLIALMFGFLFMYVKELRASRTFILAASFFVMAGLALWITQGSNLITGKLLENGEHLKRFIIPWAGLAGTYALWVLYTVRRELNGWRKIAAVLFAAFVIVANVFFLIIDVQRFFPGAMTIATWQTEQSYKAPLRFLDAAEPEPVVVWANPHGELAPYITAITKHYTLFQTFGEFNLLSSDEFNERYLVSQYFDRPTVQDLQDDMPTYAGRSNSFHHPKTVERGIKLCRLLHSFGGKESCGVPPTPAELMGEQFFTNLETKFTQDITPDIQKYLKKYHVSYIIKDTKLDGQYHPEKLGAVSVYDDGRYIIYKLP